MADDRSRGLDMDRMREEQGKSEAGSLIGLDEGETNLYIHPPCRENDKHEPTRGLAYVEVVFHYKMGPDEAMGLCLDVKRNPILKHPFVVEALLQRDTPLRLDLSKPCPACEKLRSGELSAEDTKEMRCQTKYFWGATPYSFRQGKRFDFQRMKAPPGVLLAGKSLHDGIMDGFAEEGNITDPDDTVLVRVTRKGQKMQTRYAVRLDSDTVKKRLQLSDKMWDAVLDAMEPGGDCDLFVKASTFVKGHELMAELLEKGSGGGKEPELEDDDDRRGGGRSRRDEDDDRGGRRSRSSSREERSDDPDEGEEPRGRGGRREEPKDEAPSQERRPRREEPAADPEPEERPRRRRDYDDEADGGKPDRDRGSRRREEPEPEDAPPPAAAKEPEDPPAEADPEPEERPRGGRRSRSSSREERSDDPDEGEEPRGRSRGRSGGGTKDREQPKGDDVDSQLDDLEAELMAKVGGED